MDEIFSNQSQDVDVFYKLLGCDELSSMEQINTEFKVRALIIHPDKNPEDPTATVRFAELQQARDILTDEKRRKEYDYWRRSGIAVSYNSWIAMKDTIHTSMHWAVKKKKDLMLEGEQEKNPASNEDIGPELTDAPRHTVAPPPSYGHSRSSIPGWTREPANDILQKFRGYQI